jgi:hypothetical protein
MSKRYIDKDSISFNFFGNRRSLLKVTTLAITPKGLNRLDKINQFLYIYVQVLGPKQD